MTAKIVSFHAEARAKVLRGVTQLADAVRLTLGPKSKSVLIQKKWGTPLVCNDGVTIAKEMELENSAVDGGVVIDRMLSGDGNVGFDAATKRYVDLFEAGIVDPTRKSASHRARARAVSDTRT